MERKNARKFRKNVLDDVPVMILGPEFLVEEYWFDHALVIFQLLAFLPLPKPCITPFSL